MKSSNSARWWDLPAALLLLAAMSTAASRLIVTRWTDHLDLAAILAFLGVLAGLALGRSIFSPRLTAAFVLIYGLFVIPWQLGLTLGEGIMWTERLASLAGRLVTALTQLARQEAVEDPLFFVSLMVSLFGVLGVHAGYNLIRYARPWRVILPTGLTLLIIQISDSSLASRIWFLAGYLLFSILLLARLTYVRKFAHWQQARISLPLYIGFDLTRVALVVTALLVLTAWTIPALTDVTPSARKAWQRATRPWATARERLSKAVAPLRRTIGIADKYGYYGEQLVLGSGNELSDTPIMTVKSLVSPPGIIRYYWRARVYDHYADGQWDSTLSAETQSVTPDDFDLTFPDTEGRSMATLNFNLAIPMSTLYTAPQPLWVSRPADVDLARNPDSTATIAQLRETGTDYPQWVTDRYLMVPSTVTTRTLELADQIGALHDNPYDIAAAVTAYMRTRIRYRETIPSPPRDQEPLDWFLFDQREGFCNYYASAEIILLRSQGIPARLAVGFAQGERQSGSGTYLVRQHDAHTWPEVYFAGIGWVEFEPTASQRPIYRVLGQRSSNDDTSTLPSDRTFSEGASGGSLPGDRLDRLEDADFDPNAEAKKTATRWNLFLSVSLVLIIIAWQVNRRYDLPSLPILLEDGMRRLGLQSPPALRRWSRRFTFLPIERAYLELNSALARLGAPPAPADTPAERAASLACLLPVAADPAQQLLAEYNVTSYSLHLGNLHTAQDAARTIRNLSRRTAIRRKADRILRPLAVFWRRLTPSDQGS